MTKVFYVKFISYKIFIAHTQMQIKIKKTFVAVNKKIRKVYFISTHHYFNFRFCSYT